MRVTLFAFVFAVLSTAAQAERPPFEFKGLRPGESSSLVTTAPGWRCTEDTKDRSISRCFSFKETIAGVPAKFVGTTIRDEQIISVSVSFPSASFSRVADALKEKYGQPDSSSDETVQNRLGAKFLDTRQRWIDGTLEKGGPMMVLRRYSNDISQSSLHIAIVPSADKLKEQREEDIKKDSGDL